MDFTGKRIVLTGASIDGFGGSLALCFARLGAELYISARALAKARATADAVRAVLPDAQIHVQLIGVGTGSKPPSWAHGEGENDAPCPGYTFDQSIPITSDELDAVVKWKERSSVGEWAGKPVRLHFRLRSMRIYAFQFLNE